jgi:DNA repair exonuclease SbcCD nuclease subunit
MLLARQQLKKLAGLRADGTRRQVVLIAGNHDLPAHRREACWIELMRDIPGVHIISDEYEIVRFKDATDVSEELRDVEVHCLPHDVLKDMAFEERFEEVQPTPGKTNILVAHGVAGGSSLYRRIMGREFAIPTDVLSREWSYGALGHWHRQGPVGVKSAASRCWYAGSSENMGFGDLLDNGEERGYLRVEVTPTGLPKVSPKNLPIRSMFRLGAVDGAGKTPDEIEQELIANVEKAREKNTLAGSIVGQIVQNTTRDIWALVDWQKARTLAVTQAMHYEITVQPVRRPDAEEGTEENISNVNRAASDVLRVMRERAEVVLTATERTGAVAVATGLLERRMKHVSSEAEQENTDGTGESEAPALDTTTGEVAGNEEKEDTK